MIKKIFALNIMEPVDKQVESQPKAAPEQDKDQPKAAPEQDKDQPKAAPEQTEKKNPKRVEQGQKLAEWNKQRLSRSAQPATQPTTQVEATRTDETPLKHKTKDYVLLAETMLIVGLVGVGLYYFANQNDDQPVEISVKKRAQLEPATGTAATSPKDDVFDM